MPSASIDRQTLRAVCLVSVIALASGLIFGQVPTSGPLNGDASGQTPVVEAKTPELYQLKSEDLIKAARAIYDKVDGDYRAQVRGLAAAEVFLADARQQYGQLTVPPAPTTAAAQNPKTSVDLAKARKAAAAEKLRLAQLQKSLLDRVAGACDAIGAAETAYLNALDDLKPYAVEIRLRIADKTLAAEQAPPILVGQALATRRGEIQEGSEKRKARVAAIAKEQEAAAKAVEDANKSLLAADAELTEASNSQAQDDRVQELKRQYAGKKPQELTAQLNQMADEGIGLKGDFELGLSRFTAAASQSDRLRKQVEAMKQPEVKIPQISRPEDVEQAATGTQKLIEFYQQRATAIDAQLQAVAEVLRLGAEFNADAAVSTDHLFKMRVLAEVLKGLPDVEANLDPNARPDRVLAAARQQSSQAATVQAAIERAKADRLTAEKQLAQTQANAAAANEQLAKLRQTQAATLAAIAWESTVRTMKPEQVIESFNTTSKDLADKLAALEKQRAAYQDALSAANDLAVKLDGLKDPLLRAAEEAGQGEKEKILGTLQKDAGLIRTSPSAPAPSAAGATPSATAKAQEPKGAPAAAEKKPIPSDLENTTASLQAFQQLVSGRLRVIDEYDRVGTQLLASIAALESQSAAYGKLLSEARQLALQLHATAIDLKKRIGKGEISSDTAPPQLVQALRPDTLNRLDEAVTTLLAADSQFKQRKEQLQVVDPAVAAGQNITREVLTLVGQRLDLLSDLRRLDAAYKLSPKDREPGEIKRLDQEAAERQDSESSLGDSVLSLDTSKRSKTLAELLESDYRECIDLEYRQDNLRQQRRKAEQLTEIAQKEQAAIARVLPQLQKRIASLEAARDEQMVLAEAQLKPDQADELLKAYRAKTGRLLPKPVPLAEKDKADAVARLADQLFDKTIQVTATRNWYELLSARLAPTGIKAEAGVYQDEISKMNAASGANNRRVEALTGQKPPEPGSREAAAVQERQRYAGVGGSIARTRAELSSVRRHGVLIIGMKILAILFAAWMLPRVITPLARRGLGYHKGDDEHGNAALLLHTLGVFIKTAIWITAIAIILSVLGFDVTAIVAGLGIGGLAIGLAAQPVIADVISAIIIFAERRFTIGDVIKIGGDDPAKVVGLSWRGTQLKGPDGLVINIPNRNITSVAVRNLTKEGRTFDSLSINILTQKDAGPVLSVIKKAIEECKYLTSDSGYALKEYQHKGDTRVIKYQFWWYLRDYDVRNKTRDEVFNQISSNLSAQNLVGTEVTLA